MQSVSQNVPGTGESSRTARHGKSLSSDGVGLVIEGLPEETASAPLRRRANRRASTGTFSLTGLSEQSKESTKSNPEPEMDDAAFIKMARRGSLTKQRSEEKLKLVTQPNDYKDRDDKILMLQDRFSQSKPKLKDAPRRVSSRRSSLSSYTSSHGAVSHTGSYVEINSRSRSGSKDEFSSDSFADISHNMSANTIPMTNVVDDFDVNKKQSDKKQAVVESLVWFSFHTPRTVLEDLISHEIELWRREEKKHLGHELKSEKRKDYKMAYMNREEDSDDDDDDSSMSSLSDDGNDNVFDGSFSEAMMRLQGKSNGHKMLKLPKCVKRESAVLFVDITGFTKLSTLLDVESLSKVINSYFDMIVNEVISFGGDILKFAGDAFFAEWRVTNDEDDEDGQGSHPLSDLNASLASINEIACDDDIPKLSLCVLSAAKCAASIVRKFSDYQVTSDAAKNTNEAMLNVHCGIGVGNLVGLHVGDYKEGQEEGAVELRREFMILGSPIDQVSKAAEMASDGEVMASPEATLSLAFCCDMTDDQRHATEPVCIASRDGVFFEVFPDVRALDTSGAAGTAVHPYESLRMHCKSLNNTALARLHLQMALYVHPVIRGDELALSAAIQAGKIAQPSEAVESRHRAEAELRSVLTIFVKAVISPRITGLKEVDDELYKGLCDIMHVTTRELDRYSGHLRQFIVDDKGVVLIATFGLRGSTFPNMISNNGLPAIFSIHRALRSELKVESRVGATFGKVYCGVVGGVRRHEFAVMGAPVNLAARLMSSKVNRGILVDEAVREQADARYAFSSLPPVQAKGYDKPVPILEPVEAAAVSKKKKSSVPLIGRKLEKETIKNVATAIMSNSEFSQSTMVFLMGESGMGKTALAVSVADEIKASSEISDMAKTVVCARSTSNETEQRIPLSSFRKVFLSVVHDFCVFDGTLTHFDDGKSVTSFSASTTGNSMESHAATPRNPRLRALSARTMRTPESAKPEARPSLIRGHGLRGVDTDINDDLQSLASSAKDSVSQATFVSPGSMRQITRKVEAGKKYLPSSLNQTSHSERNVPVPQGLSKSLHPMTPRPQEEESLAQSLHRISMARSVSLQRTPKNTHSTNMAMRRAKLAARDDSSTASFDASVLTARNTATVPYFEKLCWVCEQLNYPYEYADIVGSQFLGLDGASPVTHVEGHIPTMDELSDFLALAFISISHFADLTVVLLDDFQWVDSFSWKIFQVLCKKAKKLLVLCATRSHDRQALRRLSTAATGQNQLQSRMIEISLGPLDFNDIRVLTSKVLAHDEDAISDALCTDIFQWTGGLPVYVVQVLENIKRKRTLELDDNGQLQWTAEGLKEKRATTSNKTGVVMEETFLSRFDTLDVRVRKVLQTCAVLGLSFALSDVIQVHPDLEEIDLENALDVAIDEMILIEQIEEDDDNASLKSGSTGTGESEAHTNTITIDRSRGSDGVKPMTDRFFQFSHAMWRQNVLKTMLKERKVELHRLIAEAMEKDQVLILEQSDISRLLTLFDHWKACGDFCKTAPLALAVGARLEEWDLSAQSLELYEDALEMSYDTVQRVEDDVDDSEWVQVAAKPAVLDYILRLHIRIGLCHQNLGEESESICMFEDAYNIIETSSKIPGSSKALMMPIVSSLCVLKLEQVAVDSRTKLEQEKLAEKFVKEAIKNGNPVHIGRALSMKAGHHAKSGNLELAFGSFKMMESMYDVGANSFEMIAEYGRDYAIECYSESVQWLYLQGEHDKAEVRADLIVDSFLPLLVSVESDIIMYSIFPLVQVYKLIGRTKDAEKLLKKYVITPHKEGQSVADYWSPLFNPLVYLLELIMMEENDKYNSHLLVEMEAWVMNDENYEYRLEMERKAFTIMGEICWRLMNLKEEEESARETLASKARDLLTPIASYPHPEIFLKNTAQALLEAL